MDFISSTWLKLWHGTLGSANMSNEDLPIHSSSILSYNDLGQDGNTQQDGNISILSLPPEIWAAIFELGKRMSEDNVDVDGVDRAKNSMGTFQLAVSHTCQYFLRIVLRSPRLWTSIQIDTVSPIEWLTECIKRSGSCWLDIRVDFAHDVREPTNDETRLRLMLHTIIPESRRWRSLSVIYPSERGDNPLISYLFEAPAPGLHHLSIQLDRAERVNPDIIRRRGDVPQIFTSGTPELKFVRLRGLALHIFRPQLSAVETLHLDQTRFFPLTYQTLRSILTSSPVLAHLSIYGDIIDPSVFPWPGRSDVIHLPKLLSLRLYSQTGDMYSGLLLGIEAPSLVSLVLKDLQEGDLDPLWDLMESARYKNLRHLTFCGFDPSMKTYQQFFKAFPEISSFFTATQPISESLLIQLLKRKPIFGHVTPIPWPQLEELTFPFEGAEEDTKALEAVLENREFSSLPLFRFYLIIDPDFPVDMPRIMKYRRVLIPKQVNYVPWPKDNYWLDYDDDLFL